ncbi:ATP-binding protein [Spirosoma spitsbergense]|uniref:ATP-binding protein n=1 Tax=Spirosoma spitsbergense TaxID=431554 RepID=UPI00036013EC|nr:ATP-binding protein [Spirosoma spitsbergense]
MFRRKIYEELEAHLLKKQVTVITGMRRVGKSTAVRHLLNRVPHTNVLYLDLERIENRILFNQQSYNDIERGLQALGLSFTEPAVVALDEIQLVPAITSVIKSLYDTYNIKFIVTGSSSFYLKNHFSESLAGRKQIFEMHTLDFEEFLLFRNQDLNGLQVGRMQPFLFTFYDRWLGLYEEFVQYGGFPEVVLSDSAQEKTDYLKDVLNAYIELDIKLLADFSLSDTLYKLIQLLAVRVGSRMDYSKLASLIGENRNKVKDYLHLLEYTYFIQIVRPYTGGLNKELTKQPKFYFSDTGLLQLMGQVSSGQLFENAIANQLTRLGPLNYYERTTGTEIDFILDRNQAFEVKETCTPQDVKVLNGRAKLLDLSDSRLIGRHWPASGFSDFVWGGSVW